jgi:hypothetical protein
MMCEKCSNGKGFCPVTFGLALGLTCFIFVIICSAWMLWFGVPHMFQGMEYMKVADWSQAGMFAVCALIKGFLFGFVFALIYDLIKCCKSKCCGKCSCCTPDKK